MGTHIHFLEPVSLTKQVWHLNYQDVIAIGKLFTTGELCAERIIAIGGPQATQPRLVRTLLGADLTALLAGETKEGENRIISGSLGHFLRRKLFNFSTSTNGGERAMVPIGNYERVIRWIFCPPCCCAISWPAIPTVPRRWAVWSWTKKIWRCVPTCVQVNTNMDPYCARC